MSNGIPLALTLQTVDKTWIAMGKTAAILNNLPSCLHLNYELTGTYHN